MDRPEERGIQDINWALEKRIFGYSEIPIFSPEGARAEGKGKKRGRGDSNVLNTPSISVHGTQG